MSEMEYHSHHHRPPSRCMFEEETRMRPPSRCMVEEETRMRPASRCMVEEERLRKRVLVGCTGSVATIKVPQLVSKLVQRGADVRLVVTERAKHFLKEAELPSDCQVLSDTVEWAAWQGRGDPVLHIDLVKWADLFLIAPLDANTLGKMASGICDNILTCVARAWDTSKPLVFCPAMNTRMWEHPVTAPQVELLKSWGYKEVPCISKKLMCGDTGIGGMAEVDNIIQMTLRTLHQNYNPIAYTPHTPHTPHTPRGFKCLDNLDI